MRMLHFQSHIPENHVTNLETNTPLVYLAYVNSIYNNYVNWIEFMKMFQINLKFLFQLKGILIIPKRNFSFLLCD